MKLVRLIAVCAISGSLGVAAIAADTNPPPTSSTTLDNLFPDEVVCQGKGVNVKRSQVDRAVVLFKSNAAARGSKVPDAKRAELEALVLDKLVLTQLLEARATDADKKAAQTKAETFTTGIIKESGSDEAFQRQLQAMGFTRAEFDAQILERAVSEEVVDRELKRNVKIPDAQVRKYYDDNLTKFQRPEMVRVSHILLATREPVTGAELEDAKKKAKREQIDKILERVRKGEDFAALVKEFSEDTKTREQGGEYLVGPKQMPPEFEKAAYALQTNQVSDIVTTAYGYHIIKSLQRIPPETIEFSKVEADIRDMLAREEVQEKLLPEFLKKIKTEAKVEYLHGAKSPESFGEDLNSPTPGAP